MQSSQSFERKIGGKNFTIESGKLAGQADTAVTVTYGETVVLVTLCVSKEPREGVDFLPLTIDYEERLYAAGKIPGGFIRREGRPSQEATLAMRMTDRPLRPLLPKSWRNDIQLVITVLSADQENDPSVLALIGSSAALSMSAIPFAGPVGAVNVGYINGKLILNPTLSQLEESQLDLIVASTKEAVVMIEAGAEEISEDIVIEAIEFAHKTNLDIIELEEELQQACGRSKQEAPVSHANPELAATVSEKGSEKLRQAMSQTDKALREQGLSDLKTELVKQLENAPKDEVASAFDALIKAEIRASILDKGHRLSGRKVDEVRALNAETGLLPRTHGSGLFTRGQTQVLTITTLGSTRKEQQLDGLGIEATKRFMHHYNFPPFSTGEAKRIGGSSRREIGHGALAERSLLPVIPKGEDFPYTIRLVSEVLSSSGSTSMASICASSLSLMDAGIPITRPVAGIAMGLVTDKDGSFTVLTDIEGFEDNYGDMDYKVAGTSEGITGMQMDTKLQGISQEIIRKTLSQAKDARLFILETMNNEINTSRPELSRYAPRVYKISIPPDKIGTIIGPGGKTIRSISDENKVDINVENDGAVLIGSPDEASARKAISIIEGLTKEAEIGTVYTGKVSRILPFGAMVEILPGKEGLVHISELADYRVGSVEDIVKMDDEVTVKVIEIDNIGRINLSRRAMLENSGQTGGGQDKKSTSGDRPPSRQQQGNNRPPRGNFPPRR